MDFVGLRTLFRRDQDHTKRSARTVDRRRSRIFQYGNAFDVGRVDKRQVLYRNAVDDQVRITLFAVAQRTDTTDLHRRLGVDTTFGVQNRKARNDTLQRLGYVHLRLAVQCLVNIYYGNGTRQVGFLLCTVTHYHHFVEKSVVVSEDNVHVGSGFQLLSLVAEEGDLNRRPRSYFHRKLTVKVGRYTSSSAFLQHVGANDGLAFGVFHRS